jgi:hypothetical protein
MSQWGMIDRANNSPIFAPSQVNLTPNRANANTLFGNTTFGAYLNNGVAMNEAVGVFGIDTTEAGNTVSGGTKAAHAGWNMRTAYTGSLATLTVTTVGKLYTNGDVVTVNPGAGLVSSNATAIITTNASGNIISTSITSVGAGFITATPSNITVANSTGGATTGSNAVFAATAGGRAGRVQLETLVASGSITGDDDGTIF